jgi:hypothetical protein
MSELSFAHKPKPFYIAVSEHGFGIHQVPAAAIRLAQDEVPATAKPSQLLVYESMDEVTPTDWKNGGPVWPNHAKIRLVGLTTTHRLFVQSLRLTYDHSWKQFNEENNNDES